MLKQLKNLYIAFLQKKVGFCVASGEDPNDPFAELDPDISCPQEERISDLLLKPCKPNCRGGKADRNRGAAQKITSFVVNFSVVSGGAALIAASTATGVSYLAPVLGGLLFGNF